MKARLCFPRGAWDRVLPGEAAGSLDEVKQWEVDWWLEMPEDDLPSPLVAARNGFWDVFRKGGDTRDLPSWGLSDSDAASFLSRVAQDPSAVTVVLSRERTPAEGMADFYEVLLRESSKVLEEENVQDGSLSTKLVDAKAKMFGNFRQHAEAFLKLESAARDRREAGSRAALAAPLDDPRPDEDPEVLDGPPEGVLAVSPEDGGVPSDEK